LQGGPGAALEATGATETVSLLPGASRTVTLRTANLPAAGRTADAAFNFTANGGRATATSVSAL
jgi:hypothetical protein